MTQQELRDIRNNTLIPVFGHMTKLDKKAFADFASRCAEFGLTLTTSSGIPNSKLFKTGPKEEGKVCISHRDGIMTAKIKGGWEISLYFGIPTVETTRGGKLENTPAGLPASVMYGNEPIAIDNGIPHIPEHFDPSAIPRLVERTYFTNGERWDPAEGVPASENYHFYGGKKESSFYINGIRRRKNPNDPAYITYFESGGVESTLYTDSKGLPSNPPCGVPALSEYYENGALKASHNITEGTPGVSTDPSVPAVQYFFNTGALRAREWKNGRKGAINGPNGTAWEEYLPDGTLFARCDPLRPSSLRDGYEGHRQLADPSLPVDSILDDSGVVTSPPPQKKQTAPLVLDRRLVTNSWLSPSPAPEAPAVVSVLSKGLSRGRAAKGAVGSLKSIEGVGTGLSV